MQEVCLRLMGRKLLVAFAMEGKFASGGLQAIDGDDDMLTANQRHTAQTSSRDQHIISWLTADVLNSEPSMVIVDAAQNS